MIGYNNRSDLILFLTSAERPLTESESKFLSKISKWGKKVILIVNKIDILNSNQNDEDNIVSYVKNNAIHIMNLYGHDLPIFPCSGKDALHSKLFAKGIKSYFVSFTSPSIMMIIF
jgi:predicted GTPase